MRRRQMAKIGVIAVALLALVAIWILTPIRELADREALARAIAPWVESPFLPGYVLGGYVVGGALFLPNWLLIFQTSLLFKPVVAILMALGGATLSAAVFFGLGRLLGRDVVLRMVKPRIHQAIEQATLESIIAIRVVPILPYSLVNMACGAFGVSLKTFLVGTVIGMTPLVTLVTLLGERVVAVVSDPTPGAIAALIGAAIVFVGIAQVFRRRAAAQYLKDATRQMAASQAATQAASQAASQAATEAATTAPTETSTPS